MPVCGSPATLPQFAPPHAPGNWMCGRRWLDGVKTPSFAASRTSCFSFSCSSGLTNGFTSSASSTGARTAAAWSGTAASATNTRRALRSSAPAALRSARAAFPFSARTRTESRLAGLRHDLDRLAVVLNRQELRRRGIVVVPQIVMHDLEMPQPLSGRASSASRQLPNRLSP